MLIFRGVFLRTKVQPLSLIIFPLVGTQPPPCCDHLETDFPGPSCPLPLVPLHQLHPLRGALHTPAPLAVGSLPPGQPLPRGEEDWHVERYGCFLKWWYPHFTPQNDHF